MNTNAIPLNCTAYLINMKNGKRTRLDTAEFRIGRTKGNHLVIDNPKVSQCHAKIRFDFLRGLFLLIDTGSLNHTRINGQAPLAPSRPQPLDHGTRLTLANEQFQFFLAC